MSDDDPSRGAEARLNAHETPLVDRVQALLRAKFPTGEVNVEDVDPAKPSQGHLVVTIPTRDDDMIHKLKVEYTCEEETVGLELEYEASKSEPHQDDDFMEVVGMRNRLQPEGFIMTQEGEEGRILVYFSLRGVSVEELGDKLAAIKLALAEQNILQ